MEALREYLKAERGRLTQLAKALDLFPSGISQWKEIPPKHVLEIERLTGISRHDLRPDLYGPAPALQPQEAAVPAGTFPARAA